MKDIFRPGHNCWRIEKADYMSMVVDYGNYYRDLHESLMKAEKSIFVLGWDIDSRIELLRGQAGHKSSCPTFFEMICKKARENPDLQIYLNRWDYSLFFMRQREQFWEHKWKKCGQPNIHVCMDNVLPFSACHHQKVVVIDDETAYWGGMDVALGRWDMRQHHVRNKYRRDPPQLPSMDDEHFFNPYHDIQAVLSGPAARALAEWVRVRWRAACPEVEPVPLSPPREGDAVPKTWPDTDGQDFAGTDMVIARTMPAMNGKPQVEEIYHLLQDEIAQAENFIYMENQYFVCEDIARAINKRLREKPDLRVLAVTCYDPQGFFERVAMWGGRVLFTDAVRQGGVKDRVALAYPLCREKGKEAPVHIHSKLMIIDDRLLHVGSANLNNRSMGMDTELDITLIGDKPAAREKIAAIRNDLIHEHTGHDPAYTQAVVDRGDVRDILIEKEGSRQHLRELNDEQYRSEKLTRFILKYADPRRPVVPGHVTHKPQRALGGVLRKRSLYGLIGALALLLCLPLIWSYTSLAEYTQPEKVEALFEQVRSSPFALLWVCLIYIAAGLLFFPVTVLSAAVILIFGGFAGFAYSMIGALASGIVGFGIGYAIGKDRLEHLFPRIHKLLGKIKDSGVIGVAVLRTLPIMPYSLSNLVFGVSHVTMPAFVMGTILGLLPGKIMMAVFGESLTNVYKHPTMENIILVIAGLAAWLGVVMLCNKLARGWQAHREQMAI